MRSLCHIRPILMLENVFFLLSLTKGPLHIKKKKKPNHLHTLHYLSSFRESAKTTAITSILEGTFLLWRRDHEKKQNKTKQNNNNKKKTISHWNKQLPYHESNYFHWADKPQFNPLELDFRLFFNPCRELL